MNDALLLLQNQGDVTGYTSIFIFPFVAATGPGPFSVDGRLRSDGRPGA